MEKNKVAKEVHRIGNNANGILGPLRRISASHPKLGHNTDLCTAAHTLTQN